VETAWTILDILNQFVGKTSDWTIYGEAGTAGHDRDAGVYRGVEGQD